MTLPTCNPVDFGWFAKGVPIDHLGSISQDCPVCDQNTSFEKFEILVGSMGGFGAPFFAKPFLKHSSTKGKVGGVKGRVIQCTKCNSLFAFDDGGVSALQKAGMQTELIAPDHANEYRNKLAAREEANFLAERNLASSEEAPAPETLNRVKKTYE